MVTGAPVTGPLFPVWSSTGRGVAGAQGGPDDPALAQSRRRGLGRALAVAGQLAGKHQAAIETAVAIFSCTLSHCVSWELSWAARGAPGVDSRGLTRVRRRMSLGDRHLSPVDAALRRAAAPLNH